MNKVKVFTTPTCGHCFALKKFLEGNNIEFETIDVSSNIEAQREMMSNTNQMFVPVIKIDDEYIAGFDRKAICLKLNIKE